MKSAKNTVYTLIACLAMVACGDPGEIAAGPYRVTFTTVEDTCGGSEISPANVDIEENAEAIRIVFNPEGERAVYIGRREGSKIVASATIVHKHEIQAELEMKPRGPGFRGQLAASVLLDTGASCKQLHELEGAVR